MSTELAKHIEFEAKFYPVVKAEIRQLLQAKGAKLIRPEFLQRRVTFNLPGQQHKPNTWVRVRDEGDKITLSYKQVASAKIEGQQEIQLIVGKFTQAIELLTKLGCEQKAYQETKRELWQFDNAEITIDEWPFLEPFIEIEAGSEQLVKDAAAALGFDYTQAMFGAVDVLYTKKYQITAEQINQHTPEITFSGNNPFSWT